MMSWPWNRMEPAVGVSSRLMQRNRVDLPEPDAPMTQVTSPGLTVKSTSRSTTWVPKLLERWRTSMIGSDMAGALLHVKILGLVVRVRGVVHPAGVGQSVGGVQVVVLGAVQLFLPQAQQIAGHQGHVQTARHDDGGAVKIGVLGTHHALVD